jgi:hypothetical protein
MDEVQIQTEDCLSRRPQLIGTWWNRANIKLTHCRFKDCDVTWLYGPLQQDLSKIYCTGTGIPSTLTSKANSQISTKSILKRAVPEIMLQRPLSPSSLLKHTAPLVRTQETGHQGSTRPTLDRAAVTVTGYVMSSRQVSWNASSMLSSSASGASSLGIKRKHVRFNNKVEQYVAVEDNGDDDESINSNPYSDTTSDDGLTMKRLRPRKRAPPIRRKSTTDKTSFTSDEKTTAILPSTTLNHRGHILEPSEAMKHGISIRNPTLSPRLSQETCSEHLGRFVEEEEDHDMMDVDVDVTSAWHGAMSHELPGWCRRTSTDNITVESNGMRRTSSGI